MQPSCRWAAHTLEIQSRQPADLGRYAATEMQTVRQIFRAASITVLSPTIGYGVMIALEELRIISPSNFSKDAFVFSAITLTFASAFVLFRFWPAPSPGTR